MVALQADVVGDVRPALLVLRRRSCSFSSSPARTWRIFFLARAAAREREIAIRTALGASRFHIVRQLLLETLLLALLGGAAGLLLAWWSTDALVALGPAALPRLNEIRVNGFVVAFTFGVALLTSLIFGLIPALQVSRPQVEQSLKEASRGSTGGTRSHRLRAAFVVSQFALSLVLLVGAGLLMRSFAELRARAPGFDSRGVLTFWQSLPQSRYPTEQKKLQYFQALLPKLQAIPGVTDVGMAAPLPFSDSDSSTSFGVVGHPDPAPGMQSSASHLTTDGSYFRTHAHPAEARPHLRRAGPSRRAAGDHGQRGFREKISRGRKSARATAPRRPFEETAHDRRRRRHFEAQQPREPNSPEFYIPFLQDPDSYMDIVVRSGTLAPNELTTAIRRAVHELDPQQFVPVVRPLTQMLSQTLTQSRFNTALLGAFAAVAILLAAIGIYGVIAYNVAQRTKEIGIRMALGAQRRQMLLMILRQSLTMAAIGIGVGLLSAFAATRLLSALLFGVGTTDPLTYAAVILLLAGAAFFAALLPARRAMKINPMVALHYE